MPSLGDAVATIENRHANDAEARRGEIRRGALEARIGQLLAVLIGASSLASRAQAAIALGASSERSPEVALARAAATQC